MWLALFDENLLGLFGGSRLLNARLKCLEEYEKKMYILFIYYFGLDVT